MITTETTTRVHMNPKDAVGSLEHVRSKNFRSRESHVDPHGDFEVWLDKGIYDTYSEIFGEAIADYNETQKRKDRRIMDAEGDEIGGYIQSIQEGRRGKREVTVYKVNKKSGEKEAVGKKTETQGQRVLYELILSAGNCEKQRDDRGRIMYDKDGHEIQPMRLPRGLHKACLRRFFEEFETMYTHLKLCTVGFHGDEFYYNEKNVKEWGIEHLHLCFVPWADGYTRGLPIQASIGKALKQMGFDNGEDGNGVWHNAYWYFTQDCQRRFEDIIQKEYHDYLRTLGYPERDITFKHPVAGKNVMNLDPARFREIKDMERRASVAENIVKEAEAKAEQIIKKAGTEAFKRKVQVYDKMREDVKRVSDSEAEVQKKMREADKRMLAADVYYNNKRKEADALLESAKRDAGNIDVEYERYREKAAQVDKLIEDFIAVMEEEVDVPVPEDAVTWMQKKKMQTLGGERISIYDMYLRYMKKEHERKEKEKLAEAERLQRGIRDGVRKQKEIIDEIYSKGWDDLEKEYDAKTDYIEAPPVR